jgi:hypothetical protein
METRQLDRGMIDGLLRDVELGRENSLQVVREIEDLAEGTKKGDVRLIMEHRVPDPRLMPPDPRVHVFHTAETLIAYLGKYGGPETLVLANVDGRTITATLDELPQKGREVVTMRPQIHPLAAPWLSLIERGKTDLRGLVLFLRQHRRAISQPNPAQLVLELSQITASQKVTLQRSGPGAGINGLMVETKIQGTPKNEPVDLPEEIVIYLPLFVGREAVSIIVDLTLELVSEQIVALISSPDLDERMSDEFDAMLAEVSEVDGLGVIGRGATHYGEWSWVRPLDE